MRARRDGRGFTLLELLVATTLLALISLTVLIGMRIGFRAWEKADRRLEAGAKDAAVEEYLGRALASTVAYRATPHQNELPTSFVPFQGTSQGLRWLTSYSPTWRERSGLVLTECFITGEGDSRRLVVQEFPARGDENLTRLVLAQYGTDVETGRPVFVYRRFVPTEEARTLLTGVRTARFEFLKQTRQESQWQDAWDGGQENQLPTAVRLVIEAGAGEQRWTVPLRSEVITP